MATRRTRREAEPGLFKCGKCDRVLPEEEFRLRGKWRDFSSCLACQRVYARERHQQKREQCNAARTARRRSEPRYRRSRERYLVGVQLTQAVYKGRITKPDACQECGAVPPRHLLHGHHEDYSKPFDVMWLCPSCHGAKHRKDA